MQIHVLGAAGGEVTGSCYLIETSQARVLVDCGLFQGGARTEALNLTPIPDVEKLNAILLTHAHLDHTGRLPLAAKAGYNGPIYATPATIEMTTLVLRDAARLQGREPDRANGARSFPAEELLYTRGDAEHIIKRLKPVPYSEPVEVAKGIQARFIESGHMLGSASIQLLVEDAVVTRRIVFSGDIGPKHAPILKDFETFGRADVLFLESTYGDRTHRPVNQTIDEFVNIVSEAVERKGKILVPTFAIGRAQLLITLLAGAFRSKKLPPFPVFLDSPMAIEAYEIYGRHPELFDEEMLAFLRERPIGFDLDSLRMTASSEQSRAIDVIDGPFLVMAGSGMCTAGRIVHHLFHHLPDPDTHVLIVGYQSRETLGRALVDRAREVTIFGERIPVKARIHTLGGFSAHAGQADLLSWFGAIAPSKPHVYLTHGEDQARNALAAKIQAQHGITPTLAELNQLIEL
jgi:metallo-beta-lactamase family protein